MHVLERTTHQPVVPAVTRFRPIGIVRKTSDPSERQPKGAAASEGDPSEAAPFVVEVPNVPSGAQDVYVQCFDVNGNSCGDTVGQATTVLDATGNGFDGTVKGTVPPGSLDPGPNNAGAVDSPGYYAMTLSSTAYLQVNDGAFAGYPTSRSTQEYAHSVEVWFKTATSGLILAQTKGSGYVPAIYVSTDNKVHASMFYHGQATTLTSTSTYADDRWHQVVVTFVGGAESLYIDGALDQSRSSQNEIG